MGDDNIEHLTHEQFLYMRQVSSVQLENFVSHIITPPTEYLETRQPETVG